MEAIKLRLRVFASNFNDQRKGAENIHRLDAQNKLSQELWREPGYMFSGTMA